MSTALTPYQQQTAVAERTQIGGNGAALDSWIGAMADITRLAEYIHETEFVPEAMRGRPAAVAAAILTGREMALDPMTSLRHIHVVKGKPGLSAELMRAQVLKAGHELRFVESTDTRCVMEGRRRGEQEWTRASFTADQAKKARIDLGGYPEDKLIARATTRLCRRKFADVVAGLGSIEELEDMRDDTEPDAPVATRRTAQRRTTTTRAKATRATAERVETSARRVPEPEPARSGPPLPGEDDEPTREYDTEAMDQHAAEQDERTQAETKVTRAQLNKLHAQLGQLNIVEKADKLTTVGLLTQRELASSSDLSKLEATQVIDMLERICSDDEPQKALDAVLAELDEAEGGDQS